MKRAGYFFPPSLSLSLQRVNFFKMNILYICIVDLIWLCKTCDHEMYNSMRQKKKRRVKLESLRARNGCRCIFSRYIFFFDSNEYLNEWKKHILPFAWLQLCITIWKWKRHSIGCCALQCWIELIVCILFFFLLRLFRLFCFKHMPIQWHLVYIQCWIVWQTICFG